MKLFSCIILGTLILITSCGPAGKMPTFDTDSISFQEMLGSENRRKFSSLPLEAEIVSGNRLWSGDNWPLNKGIINKRWRSFWDRGLDYTSPTAEEVSFMSEDQIADLSPSEKYDLLMGNYNYPLKEEVAARINLLALNWEGIGNGWAMASIHHDEPTPTTLSNPEGIQIPFGSSDIKALLSYYYAFHHKSSINQLGKRCDQRAGSSDSTLECKDDLNAGSFHIALGNIVGRKKRSFIADMDRFAEVWNYPIEGYKSEIIKEGKPEADAPKGTKRTLHLKTSITYVGQSWSNSWDPIKETRDQVTSKRLFSYTLHLDGDGLIVGGNWKSTDRPDFIWTMGGTRDFKGYYRKLSHMIKD